ncbi:hypothetical protein Vadar_009669 [Vaccinium darrowii]|uniref:Uncharacterized protein n=1 Tax=Vaccinium darrowii TaxID=229202 RepID=A0ACB7XZK6_9ERIC|nr:hypothetical protein Vadar_009669 [Vaccinium darrowii]
MSASYSAWSFVAWNWNRRTYLNLVPSWLYSTRLAPLLSFVFDPSTSSNHGCCSSFSGVAGSWSAKEILVVDGIDVRDQKLLQGNSGEDLTEEELELGQPHRVVRIGAALDSNIRHPEQTDEGQRPWLLYVDGPMTKEAKYKALIAGIQLAKAAGAEHLAVISNSQLVVEEVNGEFEAKEEGMGKYLSLVKKLIKKLKAFTISQGPREENAEADQLARLATDKEDLILRDTPIRYLKSLSITKPIAEVQLVDYSGSWAEPIIQYIKHGAVSSNKDQA